MSELLRISGLKGGYKKGVEILHGIDMTIHKGEAVGIIGLNGSGKSTLGKAIMNMIPIRQGEFIFNGETISSMPTHELVKKGISIMQQGGQVFPNLSIWENLELAFSCNNHYSFDCLRDIIPMLNNSKRELSNKMADKLSGGQKHQLALAMTLATRPKFVILDEPSAGLSPRSIEEMYHILYSVKKELDITVLLIEQNIAKTISFCNRILLLKQGTFDSEFKDNNMDIIEKKIFTL